MALRFHTRQRCPQVFNLRRCEICWASPELPSHSSIPVILPSPELGFGISRFRVLGQAISNIQGLHIKPCNSKTVNKLFSKIRQVSTALNGTFCRAYPQLIWICHFVDGQGGVHLLSRYGGSGPQTQPQTRMPKQPELGILW